LIFCGFNQNLGDQGLNLLILRDLIIKFLWVLDFTKWVLGQNGVGVKKETQFGIKIVEEGVKSHPSNLRFFLQTCPKLFSLRISSYNKAYKRLN
jgi:hypothetical protein